MLLDVRVSDHCGVRVAHVSGQLDRLTTRAFLRRIRPLLGRRIRLVIDFSGLVHVGGSGVRGIVSLVKGARKLGCDVRFAGIRGQPARIFRLLGLDWALGVHRSVEDAIDTTWDEDDWNDWEDTIRLEPPPPPVRLAQTRLPQIGRQVARALGSWNPPMAA